MGGALMHAAGVNNSDACRRALEVDWRLFPLEVPLPLPGCRPKIQSLSLSGRSRNHRRICFLSRWWTQFCLVPVGRPVPFFPAGDHRPS